MSDWLEDVMLCARCGNAIYPRLGTLHGGHEPSCPSARIYDEPYEGPMVVLDIEPEASPLWRAIRDLPDDR